MTSPAVETEKHAEDEREHLICPLCDYDLRGLTEARCPECGYAFTWEELRDPARRLHPYLFEHHAERNVWSFRKTLLNSLLPRRFWRTLFPTQPSRPRRLMLYWALVTLLGVTPFLLAVGYRMYEMDQRMRQQRATHATTMSPQYRAELIARHGSVEAMMDTYMPLFPSPRYFQLSNITGYWELGTAFRVTTFALLWPFLTFASLMVFRASMRRARVRPIHVLRCVVYSADVAALVAAITTIVWFFYEPWLRQQGNWSAAWWQYAGTGGAVIVVAFLFAVLTYRLWIAFRRYLRFEHALATALASQIMIALLTIKLAADLYTSSWG